MASVSVATVSHVVNGTRYVSPERRSRIEDAIKTLNYRPNKIARALNTRGIPLLALIVPDISNPYWSTAVRAVQDVTDRHNYSVIVCSSDGILEREVRFLRSLSGWVSGVILHPYHISQETVREIVGEAMPVVVIGDFPDGGDQITGWDHIFSSNLQSSQLAVRYLVQLGHRRIAFIRGPEGTPTSIKRLTGYYQALEEGGIPVDESLVVPGDYTREGGRNAMRLLMSLENPPGAVFCANDLSALGALEAAQQRGLRVPADLSIVGFDDIDEAAHATPPLTTIRQPPEHLGEVAAETLIERLTGRDHPSSVFFEGRLVIRESAASPPMTGQG